MNEVKVTVLMPAYNAAKYIAEAVNSVLQQTFRNFELLIIDDGSIDNTVAEIRRYNDSRIRLIECEHQGVAKILNKGLEESKGLYIARFDADDICDPLRLEKQFDFLNSNPDYVLCGSDAEYIAENGEHLFYFRCIGHTHEEIADQLYAYCPVIHSAVMYRKEAILKAGGYPVDAHNFEDHLLWIQTMKYGKYCNLPERLIKVRFNPASVTIDEKWRGIRFRQLKKKVLNQGFVTPAEGKELWFIIKGQENRKIKEGAYYALCGKKFLINNHQPLKARLHLSKAIRIYPLRLDNYVLYLLTYFPKPFIRWLHNKNS
jgi:glycosyltransferase involved in cell wall biosynthesis